MQIKVEVDEEEFDRLLVEELTQSYNTCKHWSLDKEYDKKVAKALKRVIEYYGGSVE